MKGEGGDEVSLATAPVGRPWNKGGGVTESLEPSAASQSLQPGYSPVVRKPPVTPIAMSPRLWAGEPACSDVVAPINMITSLLPVAVSLGNAVLGIFVSKNAFIVK